MNSKCAIRVALSLTGSEFSPEEVTKTLGLHPTEEWRKGETIGRTALKRKHNGWVLSLPIEKTIEFGDLLEKLIDMIDPFRDRISTLVLESELDIEISCAIYFEDETPVLNLPADLLNRISALGADLDIDLILGSVSDSAR